METRRVALPRGGFIDLDYTQEFEKLVRKQFDIAEGMPVDDEHVRMFIYASVKSGLDKLEAEDGRSS